MGGNSSSDVADVLEAAGFFFESCKGVREKNNFNCIALSQTFLM